MVRNPRAVSESDPPASETAAVAASFRDAFYVSSDGLSLHARDYGDAISPYLPVVCLPGLTRTARDFDELATFLAFHRHRPRRVLAFDYRGRGGSAWDKNVDNYNPLTEMNDVLDGMSALGISRALILGTSRGGIIALLMGVARPAMIAGVVLNDIGPVIEPRGLARIKTYVGRTPAPDDWADAVRILRRLHGAQFTGLDAEGWDAFARMTYREVAGRPAGDYDPALGRTFDGVEFDRPMPSLWDHFKSLRPVPMLAIRGGNSDLLSAETLTAMAASHPDCGAMTVPGQGHAPLLRGPALLQQIAAFVTRVEGAGPPIDAVIPREHVLYDHDREPEPADVPEI